MLTHPMPKKTEFPTGHWVCLIRGAENPTGTEVRLGASFALSVAGELSRSEMKKFLWSFWSS